MTTGTFTADTLGQGGLACSPSVLQNLVVQDPVFNQAGVVQTWATGVDAEFYDQLNDETVQEMRVTAATLKLEYIGDDFNNGGEIAIKMFTNHAYATTNWAGGSFANFPNHFSAFSPSMKYVRAKESQYVTFTPANDLVRRTYEPYTGGGGQTSDITAGLRSVLILLRGGNTTNPQSWRWTVTQNVEFIWEPTVLLARSSTPSPPRNASFVQRYSEMSQIVVRRGWDMIPLSFKERMLKSLAAAAGTYVGGAGGGAIAGGAATMYLEVD